MRKRALIVGISDYGSLQPSLYSSAFESPQWRRLLMDVYGFADRNTRFLSDREATKSSILERLEWLLGDTRPGDQVVFIFCGHGLRAHRRDSLGDVHDLQDEGLIAYPASAIDPVDVSIFDDDLARLYCDMKIAPQARPTFIFDCCYSAGFDFSEPERAVRPILGQADYGRSARGPLNLRRFGLQVARGGACTPPLVVAASGEYDLAIEVRQENQARSLFSSLAITALRNDPHLTYQGLVSRVTPDMKFARQTPYLTGDPVRIQQRFLT